MTERELEVLRLLAEGLLATSIASRLSLSPRTVHKHLGNIYRKLGVHDRLVAVSLARLHGMLGDELPPLTGS
ncbi:MAG: response regulator transcription factor [Micropruina sp.]|nr:MAG: response regulator transcription factor [Micropruina sp.]